MAYLLGENRFLKNAAWSKMSNFLALGGDDKNLERNADWEAPVKMLSVNFVTQKSISQ